MRVGGTEDGKASGTIGDAQVEAIKVQLEAASSRERASALEKQAMWDALAEVVRANPEAASNVAIVERCRGPHVMAAMVARARQRAWP